MAVDERARHALHSRLEEMLGPDVTGTLMELLAHEGGADVATRQDVERSQEVLSARFDAQIADLRAEMADLRSDLRTEMADGFGQVRSEIATAQRQVLFAMLGAMFTLTGLVWAIVSLSV